MGGESDLRREIVRIGKLLYDRQLIVAAEGNLSGRLGGGFFLTTPTGVCKGDLAPYGLVVIDDAGRIHRSGGAKPSSEWPLHREIYFRRPDIHAICHAHAPYATAFACAGRTLDTALLPEALLVLGEVPTACYGTPSTEEVPASVRDLILHHDAVLMANHGVVACGTDLVQAYHRLETVEMLAQITLLAESLGGGKALSTAQVEALRRTWGR